MHLGISRLFFACPKFPFHQGSVFGIDLVYALGRALSNPFPLVASPRLGP